MPYKKLFASFFFVCKLVDMKLASMDPTMGNSSFCVWLFFIYVSTLEHIFEFWFGPMVHVMQVILGSALCLTLDEN